MNIGKTLRDLREGENLTQKEIANFLGITFQTYSRYELGLRQPPYETLVKLAKFYDVNMDYIFDFK